MGPSTQQVKIIEETWATAKGIDGVTETFYNRMFEMRPDYLTGIFKNSNIKVQAKMLSATLDVAIGLLRKPDELVPVLSDLGLRHCRYGVRPEDYKVGGAALLWTLEYYFKEKFTPEVRDAWAAVWSVIESVMSAPCTTPRGIELLAEYDARAHPPPRGAAFWPYIAIAVAACAIGVVAANLFSRPRA